MMKTKKKYEKPVVKVVVMRQTPLLQSASVKDWHETKEENWGGDES